jgi:cytidylate kinase
MLVTGIQAAGKSTIAQLLAERLPRSVHLRGDLYRRMVINGRADMTPDPWLGKDQLVRRVWTTRTVPLGTDNGAKRWKTTITDARLTGWGAKMDIAIPSDEETASSDA